MSTYSNRLSNTRISSNSSTTKRSLNFSDVNEKSLGAIKKTKTTRKTIRSESNQNNLITNYLSNEIDGVMKRTRRKTISATKIDSVEGPEYESNYLNICSNERNIEATLSNINEDLSKSLETCQINNKSKCKPRKTLSNFEIQTPLNIESIDVKEIQETSNNVDLNSRKRRITNNVKANEEKNTKLSNVKPRSTRRKTIANFEVNVQGNKEDTVNDNIALENGKSPEETSGLYPKFIRAILSPMDLKTNQKETEKKTDPAETNIVKKRTRRLYNINQPFNEKDFIWNDKADEQKKDRTLLVQETKKHRIEIPSGLITQKEKQKTPEISTKKKSPIPVSTRKKPIKNIDNQKTPVPAVKFPKTPILKHITTEERRSTFEFENQEKKSPIKIKLTQQRTKKLVGITCTKLSRCHVKVFEETVAKLGGFKVENKVSDITTHLVAGEASRTVNMLRAIARGCWIVRHEWVSVYKFDYSQKKFKET